MTTEEIKVKCLEVSVKCRGNAFGADPDGEEVLESAKKFFSWVNENTPEHQEWVKQNVDLSCFEKEEL